MKIYLRTLDWHPFGGVSITFTTRISRLVSSLPIKLQTVGSAVNILSNEEPFMSGWAVDITIEDGEVSDIHSLRDAKDSFGERTP